MTLTREAIELLSKAEATRAADEALASGFDRDSNVTVLAKDFGIHDLEKFAAHRRRPRGTMTTNNMAAFAAYVEAHRQHGTTVFIEGEKMEVTAVLNMGDPDLPGHCDDLAVFEARRTAAYLALLEVTGVNAIPQRGLAEWMEDWGDHIECSNSDGDIDIRKAIGAVRNVTVEATQRVEAKERELGADRTAFESVQASSAAHPLPTWIEYTCVPFLGLPSRTFRVRVRVIPGDKPAFSLVTQGAEQHEQEMAEDLAKLTRDSLQLDGVAVLVGAYEAAG